MSRIRIEKRGKEHVHRMTSLLTVGLGVLVGLTVILNYNNPSITGGAIFNSIYGGYGSLLIALILGILIYVYVKVKN